MTMRSIFTKGLIAAGMLGALAVGGCATDDGYGSGYTSMSVGVSSYDYDRPYYRDRYRGHRGWRDSDGDGVPNRYDSRPRNPYRD